MFTYPSFFLNLCYETYFFSWIICRFLKCPYLCNVFFIVLDLRLTKVGVQRYSFFLLYTFLMLFWKRRNEWYWDNLWMRLSKLRWITKFP